MNNQETYTPLAKDLYRVMGTEWVNFKGNLVRELIGGYEYNGKRYLTLEEVDKAITDSANAIESSLK